MKVKNLLHALGYIDDKYLIEEYNPNENKIYHQEKNNVIKGNFKRKEVITMDRRIIGIVAIAIIAVVAIALGTFNKTNNSGSVTSELLQIPNPLTEVSSVEEMKKYLGFDVPVLDKEVQNYIVIGEDKYATHARIIYKDETSFEMEKGDSDVSGIYGGTLEKEEKINNITVTFYNYENMNYANWTNNGFSYSYCNSNGEINNEEIANLIK